MKQKKITWIVGTLLTASLIASAPAHAAKKSRIPAAKRYHVTQITGRDVVLAQNHRGARSARLARLSLIENGRQTLLPNPDGQRQILMPNPDGQRQILMPNPDGQRQILMPNPDGQRQILMPNPDGQ